MTRQDHVVDVLASSRLHVDVDVGQLVAHRVHEPLEREVVTERIDVGDAGQIADERAGGAAPAGAPDPHRTDVGDDVGDREEVRRVAHPADQRELVMQAIAQRLGLVEPALVDAAPASLGKERVGASSHRRRELGEVDLLQAEIERTHLDDVQRRVAQVRTLGEERTHLARTLQEPFRVRARDVRGGDRHDPPHALQRVGQERVAGLEVAHRVRRDGADAGAFGQP